MRGVPQFLGMPLLCVPVIGGALRQDDVCVIWVEVEYGRRLCYTSVKRRIGSAYYCPSVEIAISRAVSRVSDGSYFIQRRNAKPINRNMGFAQSWQEFIDRKQRAARSVRAIP